MEQVSRAPSNCLIFSFPLPRPRDAASAAVLGVGDMGLLLPFGALDPRCGEHRSDLLTCVLVFAVHSLRPSDIKFVAAIGNVETVSLSRRWRWEV